MSATLLRVLALVAFLQFAGHGTMFVTARPAHGPAEVAVVDAMRTQAFRFAAAPRTYWDMYFGYGLEAAFVCLVESVLFWLLAGALVASRAGLPPGAAAASTVALVRSVAWLFAAANVAHLAMLVRYFAFPLPMAFDGVIALGLIAAALLA